MNSYSDFYPERQAAAGGFSGERGSVVGAAGLRTNVGRRGQGQKEATWEGLLQ